MTQILITGASSGIGQALANHAADCGYQVYACGRNQAALNPSNYDNITPLVFDVTDEQACREVLNDVSPDIVVLNAGTCEYLAIKNFGLGLFRRVFETNVFGTLNPLAVLLPQLKPGSQIVIVDSLARLLPFTQAQAYGASKAALHYIAKSLEVDLAQSDIQVQSISPGFVKTPLTDKNQFDMPMRVSAQYAAEKMLKGIEARKTSISFPFIFSLCLKLLSLLPDRMKVAVCKRMKYQ